MSPWGWPRGLVQNLQIPRTRFHEQGSMKKVPRTRFHEQGATIQERPSRVGAGQARVLVVQASIAAYLTRFAIEIFFLQFAQHKKTRKILPKSYVRGQPFNVSSTKNSFFWFTSCGFLKRPILLKYWLLRPFFYEEATCKSSTINGLLYAAKAVPSKDYFTHLTLKNARKGRWVISPNYRASHPRRFCAVGDIVTQRYDVPWNCLWDACHMARVCWGSRCKRFRSKEGLHYCLEQSARKLS